MPRLISEAQIRVLEYSVVFEVRNDILLPPFRGWGSFNSLKAQNRIEQSRLVMEDLTGD